jgi:hypothetical protein
MGLLDSFFNTNQPDYAGLLGDTTDLKQRANTTGLINMALGYLAAPKNQNLGLGRILAGSYVAGQQGAQGTYDNALNDWQTKQKVTDFNQRLVDAQKARDSIAAQEQARAKILPTLGLNQDLATAYPEIVQKKAETMYNPAPIEHNFDIAPNGSMYDKKNATPAQLTTSFSKPIEQDYNKPFLNDGTPNLAYQKFKLTDSKSSASTNNIEVNTGQKGFDNTLKLRTDFRSEPVYQAHQAVQSAYSQITSSLKQATPAGDLAGATKLMKILDPGSVVRESELGMAMAASGAMDRLTNYADMAIKGTKLTPTQRIDFQSLADSLYQDSATLYNKKREEYKGISSRNGLNELDVLGDADNVVPKNTAQPMPAKPSALTLKTGTIYATQHGNLKWNGKVFEDAK